MSGKGFSGKDGSCFHGTAGGAATTKTLEVVNWSFDPNVAVAKYNSNATGGHKYAVAGVRDSSGEIEIRVDGEDGTQLGPGDKVSLRLVVSPADGGSFNGFEIAEAVIEGAPVEVDIDNGEVVSVTYAFQSSGYRGVGLFDSYGTHGVNSTTTAAP